MVYTMIHQETVLQSTPANPLCAFTVGTHLYALPLLCVRDIQPWRQSTLPRFMAHRGMYIPLMMAGKVTGHDDHVLCPSSTLLLLNHRIHTLGIVVDSVSHLTDTSPVSLTPHHHPRILGSIQHQGNLVFVLSLEHLFAPHEVMTAHTQAA
jgi:chemotaxis signal transduction protein